MALAWDITRAWDLQAQLQNAADAGALAAGTQIDSNAGACTRAIQAAAHAADSRVDNIQMLATDGAGANVLIDNTIDGTNPCNGNADITFYQDISDLSAPILAVSDVTANFVQVRIQPRQIDFFFAGVVGATRSTTANASATAFHGSDFCAIAPLLICNPFASGTDNSTFSMDPGGNPGPGFIGTSLIMKGSQGQGNQPWVGGNFGFLSVDGNPSVPAISGALANANAQAICNNEQLQSGPGDMEPLKDAINTRLDIYTGQFRIGSGGGGGVDPSTVNTDFYSSHNPVKGLKKDNPTQPNDCIAMSGGADWVEGANPYDGTFYPGLPAPLPEVMGYPQDSCQYAGNCTNPPGVDAAHPNTVGNAEWDLNAYWEVNHKAKETDPSFPNHTKGDMIGWVENTFRTDGWTIDPLNPFTYNAAAQIRPLTRYELYNWEMSGNYPERMPGEPYIYDDSSEVDPADPEYAQCSDPTVQSALPDVGAVDDRRIVVAVVANCKAEVHGKDCDPDNPDPKDCKDIRGNTVGINPAPGGDSFLGMFIYRPVEKSGGPSIFYAEVVGPRDDFKIDKIDQRFVVELVHGPGE